MSKVDIGIVKYVNHSSCKAWASSRLLTGASRLLQSRRSSSRFSIFVEAAKCAVLVIAILLACGEVLGQVILQACDVSTGLTSRSLFRTVCPVIRLMSGTFLDVNAALQKRFIRAQGMNITILRSSYDSWLAITSSPRMMKTWLRS